MWGHEGYRPTFRARRRQLGPFSYPMYGSRSNGWVVMEVYMPTLRRRRSASTYSRKMWHLLNLPIKMQKNFTNEEFKASRNGFMGHQCSTKTTRFKNRKCSRNGNNSLLTKERISLTSHEQTQCRHLLPMIRHFCEEHVLTSPYYTPLKTPRQSRFRRNIDILTQSQAFHICMTLICF